MDEETLRERILEVAGDVARLKALMNWGTNVEIDAECAKQTAILVELREWLEKLTNP